MESSYQDSMEVDESVDSVLVSTIPQSAADVTVSSKSRDDLYELVLAQQEQLATLQSQLNSFLKHQSAQQDEEKMKEDKRKEETKKEEEEISSLQERQSQQLNTLQLQVEEFMRSSKTEFHSSSQCDNTDTVTPTFQSIAVNTGESLFWPDYKTSGSNTSANTNKLTTNNIACTQQQKVQNKTYTNQQHNTESDQQSCKGPKRQRNEEDDTSVASNGYSGIVQVSSPSLSICSADIGSCVFEDSANSSQSISSSFKEVDMPMFDESPDTGSGSVLFQARNKRDWNTSPVLGESASMLYEVRDARADADKCSNEEEPCGSDTIANEEFYSRVMSQVQKLIEAQNISVSSTDESSSDAGVVVEEIDSATNSFSESSSTKYADDEVEDASNVRDHPLKTGCIYSLSRTNTLSLY